MLMMMRLVLLLSIVHVASAWTTSSRVSAFGGSVLITTAQPTTTAASLTMKKGKSMPPQMRGQYEKQKEMMAMREQMIAASKPGSDGLPVFNLFVRTKRANVSAVWLL
jgi:hypothetical protein